MLQLHGAVRTLIVWFTLLLTWSAYVMWCYGTDILKYILSESGLFAFYNALSTATPALMPPGLITVLLLLMVLAIGGMLSTLTLVGWSLFVNACSVPFMAMQWLRGRSGHARASADAALK